MSMLSRTRRSRRCDEPNWRLGVPLMNPGEAWKDYIFADDEARTEEDGTEEGANN